MDTLDGGRLKCDDIPNVHHFAAENIRFVIKLNVPSITFVFHHGLIPASTDLPSWEGGHPGRHAGWKPALLKEERDALHSIVICSNVSDVAAGRKG